MALTFPLSLADFLDDLAVSFTTFELAEAIEQKTTGGGEIVSAQVAPRLWQGTLELGPQTWAEHEAAMALVRALQRPGATFLASPLHLRRTGFPAATLYSVEGGVDVRVAGLPGGTAIPAGACFSFAYGVGRRALHQVVQGATANGSGIAGPFEVVPALRPGFALDVSLNFNAPVFKAVLVPGTVKSGRLRRALGDGISFSFRQTLQ